MGTEIFYNHPFGYNIKASSFIIVALPRCVVKPFYPTLWFDGVIL